MNFLSYKTFVWPQNPHTYHEQVQRRPRYLTLDGESYFDSMGPVQRQITGEGEFYGPEAFAQYKRLAALFEENTPGNLEHPIWGIRYCYFTELELTQEPQEDYVRYRFAFTGALGDGTVPK